MGEKKNKPEIRFKGFSEPWEKRTLGDIYSFQYGQFNNNPSNGGIYPVYGANGIIGGYSKSNTEDSVVIGHMGENAGSVLWGEGKHFVTYNGTISAPKSMEINPKYGYYMLFQSNIKKVCGGSGQPFLSYVTLQKLGCVIPLLIDEQTKIGTFFNHLDKLITLRQRKHDKLVKVKKSMLEKMFPRDGADVPEIRFAEFSEPWERRELGTEAEIIAGGTPNTAIKKYWEPKEIPWMSSGEINKKRLSETENLISQDGLIHSSAKWIKQDSVLIALAGQGKTRGTVAVNNIPLTTNQSIVAIIPNENINYIFLYQNLEKRYEELRIISSGDGSRGGLNKQIISNIEILCPKIEEQTKIAVYFNHLDKLITLQLQGLDKLKKIKKSCLEKMFV